MTTTYRDHPNNGRCAALAYGGAWPCDETPPDGDYLCAHHLEVAKRQGIAVNGALLHPLPGRAATQPCANCAGLAAQAVALHTQIAELRTEAAELRGQLTAIRNPPRRPNLDLEID